MIRTFTTQPNFFTGAHVLRQFFERQFENPHEAHENRFAWDYWHIKDQYTLLRTPAYHYFPAEIYQKFEEHLLAWGQRTLGCHQISPPWLSYYVDGCYQNIHADNPHGPWAYVYSLTPWEMRSFTGGETFFLKPEVLDYWNHFDPQRGFEKGDLMTEVPAAMNQLTVFDPRLPHGVREVRGTRDPREARLVIHGWFLSPSPHIEGPLAEDEQTGDAINSAVGPVLDHYENQKNLIGFGNISFRIIVAATGQVNSVEPLTNTLRPESPELVTELTAALGKARFAKKDRESFITLPLVFE